ncbi:signal peptidase II [Porticoccus sp. Uisw_050_02]|jgi:signal peptidase II|uniref:signal peptidase II n=1 Tax=Porticoccus sp. Uisw_050_02 TaxID=3230978 RepID=UPI0039E7A50A|tara:strand:- start:435 stop:911 length:477 start_codon:yes stop_codon:yes gene_type:complete
MSWQIARWYVVAIVLLIADQLAKYTITQNFLYGEYINIFPGLDFTLVHNTGAAFSFLSDAGGWQRWLFLIISLAASIVLIVWLYRLKASQFFLSTSLALILGGALGNLYDRIFLGYVIDFIDFYYGIYHWPVFNIADASITLGAVFLIFESFLVSKKV